MVRYKHLKGYEFIGCAVRNRNNIGLWAQQSLVDDPLETNPVGLFCYYPDKPTKTRWACSIGIDATGAHGCAAFTPIEQWITVFDDGVVYAVGSGKEGFEPRIESKKFAYFTNAKTIGQRAYAVGPQRKVFRRDAPGEWTKLQAGFPKSAGVLFHDIDGFNETEIYACGDHGDLWFYDGKRWTQIKLRTKTNLERLCCGGDGLVYILANDRTILVGNRKKAWKTIKPKDRSAALEGLAWYGDRVYVTTDEQVFELRAGKLAPTRHKLPTMDTYANIAARDGILVIAGGRHAIYLDGKSWKRIA